MIACGLYRVCMTHTRAQWTYSVGRYTSFLYWNTFEDACDAAFERSPDVYTANVFSPQGGGIDVTRVEWDCQNGRHDVHVRLMPVYSGPFDRPGGGRLLYHDRVEYCGRCPYEHTTQEALPDAQTR